MKKDKREKEIEDVEESFGSSVAVEEETKPNEFPDDYTLDVIADYDPSADIFRIPNKDPNYAYRFIKNDEKGMSTRTSQLLFQKGGWQMVPKKHLLRIGIKESFLAPDGSYRMGEHILAFMPKSLFDKKDAAKVQKTITRTEQIDRRLKDGDPSVGGKEIHRTMKGIQSGHKLGMSSREE